MRVIKGVDSHGGYLQIVKGVVTWMETPASIFLLHKKGLPQNWMSNDGIGCLRRQWTAHA